MEAAQALHDHHESELSQNKQDADSRRRATVLQAWMEKSGLREVAWLALVVREWSKVTVIMKHSRDCSGLQQEIRALRDRATMNITSAVRGAFTASRGQELTYCFLAWFQITTANQTLRAQESAFRERIAAQSETRKAAALRSAARFAEGMGGLLLQSCFAAWAALLRSSKQTHEAATDAAGRGAAALREAVLAAVSLNTPAPVILRVAVRAWRSIAAEARAERRRSAASRDARRQARLGKEGGPSSVNALRLIVFQR